MEPSLAVTHRPLVSDVVAVVIHFGSISNTLRVLGQLRQRMPVIVVANDLVARPVGIGRGVEWIVPSENLGYAGAIEFARPQIGRRMLMILNNDLDLNSFDFGAITESFEDDQVGIIGPLICDWNDRPNPSAGCYTRILARPFLREVEPGSSVVCDWVTGAFMLINPKLFAVSSFSTEYFLGFEDVQYCLDAQKLGFKVVLDTRVRVRHYGGLSIRNYWYYFGTRNLILFSRKNRATPLLIMQTSRLMILALRVVLADLIGFRGLRRSTLMFRGIVDGVFPKRGLLKPKVRSSE